MMKGFHGTKVHQNIEVCLTLSQIIELSIDGQYQTIQLSIVDITLKAAFQSYNFFFSVLPGDARDVTWDLLPAKQMLSP